MEPLKLRHERTEPLDPEAVRPEVTEWDQQAYQRIVSTDLTSEQAERIRTPEEVFPRQRSVLGLHWHPEFVPVDLVTQRVGNMFPRCDEQLIIPTQHNELMALGDYAGVEIDCYSLGFNLKVQLLAHFKASRLERADVLKGMLAHTFKYRASQLWEFIDSVLEPAFAERVEKAAAKTGASDELVRFVRVQLTKLKQLIDRNEATTPPDMLKNKIIRNFFNTLRERFDEQLIGHAQFFLNAVKKLVKRDFRLDYFYRTEEIIEEVRALDGGVVIPHPEQFWPILLANYDVDAIEVWNPQSREYTEFLIHVVSHQNASRADDRRRLLVTMGDDTHFGEKVICPEHQDPDKANRELGVQPAWDDLSIRKGLIVARMDREDVIGEYRARLG